ncbi:antibiotic biosynthesis monooxygenase [Temperatibacter marinus]|uniref:Antibiotic biosynthesis monooxygenase n=1 Tax=Temperatibacter marinus TaxID=1456591 RepID=A0AA52H7V6_9PROT|nr:antibiotic biosynthesis monooxygenase [Temperatibacter marinus]WND01476.1 antibiotic biosynthesis monooxygenase [Temperatibacter marinus]
MSISPTPRPPYIAVIFSNQREEVDEKGYAQTADEMVALASKQDGYLGIESVRDETGFGITVSYWRDEDAIKNWKANADHQAAQKAGRKTWYRAYKTRISTVTRDYGLGD